jgi:hypothetical protein
VIYSRWRPDGGYDYYQTAERRGLGDDLPVPQLAPVGAIGVPSTDAGRTMPAGAHFIGTGEIARGSVVPLDRSGLSLGTISPTVTGFGFLAIAALIGWWLRGRMERR